MTKNSLETEATEIRRKIVSMIVNARGGHLGSSLSAADIMAVLFFHTLNFTPENRTDPNRDRFVLSKGHASEVLYATLAEGGFFPASWLDAYLQHDSPLTIHPTNHVPGIEVCTGALGHGFSVAVGMALAAKKTGRSYKTFVLTGDGELEEGSNWEAAMAAAHFRLGNLTLIIDTNGLQLVDTVANTMGIEPLREKLMAFGFEVHEVDGHDTGRMAALFDSLKVDAEKPHAVIARTIKGRGVSFAENRPEWHHTIPTAEQGELALKELSR
ncbi:transketolase, N-terminal subunit [Spirochaetia bacterium]|nr:transketolase, N-terminal subunit [Spirochaetia bacterium]